MNTRDLFLISEWVNTWLVWHGRLSTPRNSCLLVPYPVLLSTDILPLSRIFYSYRGINNGHVVSVSCQGQLHFFLYPDLYIYVYRSTHEQK